MSAKPVIVITGAAGGIGIATIKALAAPGAQLHLIDSNESRLKEAVSLAEEAGASVSSTVSDLGTPQKCLAALPTGPGPIGALIHLAGIFVRHQMDEPGREIYNQTMQANATNAYDLVAAANNRLHKGSRIVFVSSLAFNRGSPDHIAYSMAKGSLVGLTRSLSKALGPRGVLVNALAPGIIETPMPAEIIKANGEALMKAVPLGRFGQPEEVAGVIEFLVGPGSTYVTGQLINVDGGVING